MCGVTAERKRTFTQSSAYHTAIKCQGKTVGEVPSLGESGIADEKSASGTEVVVVLAEEELVGHAGDVVADDDVAGFGLRQLFVGDGHRGWSC